MSNLDDDLVVARITTDVHGRFSWFVAQDDVNAVLDLLGDEVFDEWWDQLGEVIRTFARAKAAQKAAAPLPSDRGRTE